MRTTHLLCVLAVATPLVLAGCGSDDDPAAGTRLKNDALTVVASTNVWGDIAQQVGGDAVDVTSIISDPSQDPHSFEANTQTLLAIKNADLVVENGGGYDDFIDTMRDSADTSAPVVNAVDVSGATAPVGGELNEHVWYDLEAAGVVADAIAEALGKADPDEADTFVANASLFKEHLRPLIAREGAIKKEHEGAGIAITEPVPLYMTEAAGLTNKTPEEFSEAIEEGDDVSAAILKDTLDLFGSGQVSALIYNEQTSGPVTEEVKAAADAAKVPVVPVTETLPDGDDYVSWMGDNLEAISAALTSA